MFAVVMAGGGGTRLWPKSREVNPKQMHALAGVKPLVQEMTERLQRIVGDHQVYIITSTHQRAAIVDVMPDMAGRVFVDPYRRDTAACIGLAAVYLSAVDPDGVMGVFASDHFIGKEAKFSGVVHAAEELAQKGQVVTIGIRPTGPESGYGYIEMGESAGKAGGREAFHVSRFVEKPDCDTARKYVESGRYLWNSGMFVWSIPTVLKLYEKHLPEMFERLMRIKAALGTPQEHEVVDSEYKQMDRVSVDYGIMEKVDDTLVIPGDFDWNDIGSWATVSAIAGKDEYGNAIQASHIGLDTHGCLVIGPEGKVITTIGVENLIIVDTDDALLICRNDRAQDVKKLVDKLKEIQFEKYL